MTQLCPDCGRPKVPEDWKPEDGQPPEYACWVDVLKDIEVELKGIQLMVFEADTPERRSEVFRALGKVVSFMMVEGAILRERDAP